MQDGVIEFARDLERPERDTLRHHAVDVSGRRGFRRLDRDRGDACRAVDVDADKAIADAGLIDDALERRQRDALAAALALRGLGEFPRALGNLAFELAVRRDLVDQAPL